MYLIWSSGSIKTTTMELFGLLFGFFLVFQLPQRYHSSGLPGKRSLPSLDSAQGHNIHLFRKCFPLRLVLECGKRGKTSLVFLVEFAGRNTGFARSGGDSAMRSLVLYQMLEISFQRRKFGLCSHTHMLIHPVQRAHDDGEM